jgi:hypothetical protein
VDKVNFVIFVITPKLLEPKIDEAARARLSALFKPAFFQRFFEVAGCPWLVAVLFAPMLKLEGKVMHRTGSNLNAPADVPSGLR